MGRYFAENDSIYTRQADNIGEIIGIIADLSWKLNDTHGIGIVMLAGVELLKTIKEFEVA
jgi:hypothetical protein